MPRTHRGSLVLVASMLTASPGRSDDHPGDEQPRHTMIALFESALMFQAMTAYYWHTRYSSGVDFDLEWDWPSWRAKLSLDALRFDTDGFTVNAFRHPVMGVIHYHIARTNGLGWLGSTGFAAAQILIWDYFAEYRENPSINDFLVNSATGLAIGEPLWQIGQLWRGGGGGVRDRVRTSLFSPLDGLHDAVSRSHRRWTRPRAWRSIALDGGGLRRRLEDGRTRDEAVLGADIDVVSDRHHVAPGPQRCRIAPGTWSRLRGRIRLADPAADLGWAGAQLRSRTALAGTYQHDADGNGAFVGLGTAFTYHRDRLADGWDRVAIPHLLGPQLQLSRRAPGLAVRWDLGLYGDFAMIDAHVFGPRNPFPRPPPHVSALQIYGYYYGAGVSGSTRLRIDRPAWSFDAELDAHQIWQLPGRDRRRVEELRAAIPYTAYGVSDLRLYWRSQLGVRRGQLGLAATAEGSLRRGAWKTAERTTSELAIGVLGHLEL